MSAATPSTERVDLAITGMTCASCANRIERRLNKLEGVDAAVNYATETATVRYDAGVAVDELVAAVAAAGYEAAVPGRRPPRPRRRTPPPRCGAGSSPARCSPRPCC